MITKKTTKEDYDKTVTLVAPKQANDIDLTQLTPGEVVSLWWIGHHKDSADIPKYFKANYAIDVAQQKELFEKFDYIQRASDRYEMTVKGQKLLDEYDDIVKEHQRSRSNKNKIKILSERDVSTTRSIGSGFSISSGNILPDNFISLDIETTGVYYKSGDKIIQLSATHVINGIEVEYFDTYVHNDQLSGDFIQKLTGITEEDLLSAPTLDQVREEFMKFVGEYPIVGWNVRNFDIPCLEYFGLDLSNNGILDLMYYARECNHGGVNNTLTTVKRMVGVKSLSHNSLIDARSTALVGKLISNFEHNSSPKRGTSGRKKGSASGFKYDDDSPIFEGLRFAFTGKIEDGTYTRKEMEAIVEMHGGVVTGSLSKTVNYFVAGVQVSPSSKAGKEKKFAELQKQGVDIDRVDGKGFDRLLAEYKRTALL